jgi:hypothetical protein
VQAANEPVVELIRRLGVGTLTGSGPLLGLRVEVTSLLRS